MPKKKQGLTVEIEKDLLFFEIIRQYKDYLLHQSLQEEERIKHRNAADEKLRERYRMHELKLFGIRCSLTLLTCSIIEADINT